MIRLHIWADWSDPLLVAHTTLLEISHRGSINSFERFNYIKCKSVFLINMTVFEICGRVLLEKTKLVCIADNFPIIIKSWSDKMHG